MATICAILYSHVSTRTWRRGALLCRDHSDSLHSGRWKWPRSGIAVPRDNIEVLENQEPGLVYTFLASDMDAGSNGAVTYHIISKYHLYFNSPGVPAWLTLVLWQVFCIQYIVQCLQNTHLLRTNWRPGSPPSLPTATLVHCPPNSSNICPQQLLLLANPFTLKDIQMQQIAFFYFHFFHMIPYFYCFEQSGLEDMSRKTVFWDLQTSETLQIYHNTPEINNQGL